MPLDHRNKQDAYAIQNVTSNTIVGTVSIEAREIKKQQSKICEPQQIKAKQTSWVSKSDDTATFVRQITKNSYNLMLRKQTHSKKEGTAILRSRILATTTHRLGYNSKTGGKQVSRWTGKGQVTFRQRGN